MLIQDTAPLSVNLRDCTTVAHEGAEQSPFMSHLLEGRLPREGVIDYTAQLRYIYLALERAVRAVAHLPRMAVIADSRLERLSAVEGDLYELAGPEWLNHVAPTPATESYLRHLDALAAAGDELGLIAHHYVRYLGDLAGGQVIARRLREYYGVSEQGVGFYDFAAVGKIKPYRDSYKQRLDSLELAGEELAPMIAEANRAFGLNGAVFNDLAARHC